MYYRCLVGAISIRFPFSLFIDLLNRTSLVLVGSLYNGHSDVFVL